MAAGLDFCFGVSPRRGGWRRYLMGENVPLFAIATEELRCFIIRRQLLKPLYALIDNIDDLANILQISRRKLEFLVKASACKKYKKFSIPKRSGDLRIIESPCISLKIAQKKLCKILEPYYTPLNCVHGFVKNRSITTGAVSHLSRGSQQGIKKSARYYFKMDIADFFPSITSQRIYGLLIGKRLRATPEVAFYISRLCVGEKGLAQGSPLSPLVSNMICLSMDRSILAFAKKNGLFYTRYADDITLSTSNRKRFLDIFSGTGVYRVPEDLEDAVTKHNGHKSFRVNDNKVRVLMPDQRQYITGIVVNKKMNLPREYYRELRSCLHTWRTKGKKEAAAKYYKNPTPNETELASLEASVYGKLEHYRNIVSGNNERSMPLEKLGSFFNQCCEGRRFPVHRPEDSIFNITVFPINEKSDEAPEEGVAFFLEGIGLITARHVFDKFAFDGIKLKIKLTSVTTNKSIEMKVPVSLRTTEKQYDCVKIEIDEKVFGREFSSAAPLKLVDFTADAFPVSEGDDLTAFDVELVADADQDMRGYECKEVLVRCKNLSNPNQYGRMAQVEGEEFYLGMSGGPIVNKRGEVIGIVRSGIKRGSGTRCARSKFLFLDRLGNISYGVAPKE